MSRLLWIHTNHHSSCKTVSSLYDSVALRIFQLLASFINRAILGCFGNTGLLLHRPQLVLASSTRSPFILETISPRCSSFVWQLWLLLQGDEAKHLLKPRTQDPAPSAAPLCSPWIITTIKAVAAETNFFSAERWKIAKPPLPPGSGKWQEKLHPFSSNQVTWNKQTKKKFKCCFWPKILLVLTWVCL